MGSSSSKTLEERLQTEPIEEIYTSLFLQNNPTKEQERIEFMKLNEFKDNPYPFINRVGINGSYGIHFATQDGHYEVVKRILELGVDVNIKDTTGNTPLHIASKEGKYRCAEVLITTGADINIINNEGYTSYTIAKKYNNETIVELFDSISNECV